MSKAIDVLMTEHRLIERVLGSLESWALEAGRGFDVDRPLLAGYAEFFGRFADACHHGKEEDILFRAMEDAGFSRESGPLAVMYYEHTLNRKHVAALRAVGAGKGAVEAGERSIAVGSALEFVPLLRQHILKEDRILYPMALRALLPAQLDEIETAFERFEHEFTASGEVDRLHRLAETLESSFAGDPARMAASALTGCGMR